MNKEVTQRMKKDLELRVLLVQKNKFKTPDTLFAVVFKHSDGWSFMDFKKTAGEAREYIRNVNPYRVAYSFRIIPCKVTPKIKDPTKE